MTMKRILMNVRRSVMVFTMLMMAMVTFAVPAKPGLTRMLTLSDGRTVSAVLVGDEHGHFWRGADGKSYHLIAGTDTYQEVDGQEIIQKAKQRRAQANQRRMKRMAPRKIGEMSGGITGQKKGLIILVNFKDVSFAATQTDFNKLANQQNYQEGNFKGSMYDYFYAQSDGQFQLTFDVVGPYTVSQNLNHYGANDAKGNDVHPAEMVIEALQLADEDVNFANYDWDGDGEVEQVYVVYAGKGAADGGAANTIWPHEWTLASANYYGDGAGVQTLDGVRIDTYACGPELNGQTGETAGIGTMCHEFSHCLGYPDFYDTDYSGGQGMGYWDLMSSGSYNGNGYQPAGYTSYERWVAGWKTPTELVNTQTVSNMKALQTTGSDAYIIYNKGNRNEYYLLENRQKTGWDTSLPGKGLLILHVDYNATAWANNKPNDDPSHQRMTWVAADNNYEYTTYSDGSIDYTFAGMANDPFPYGDKNAFGKNTSPQATLYNNNSDGTKYLDSSIDNITQNADGTVSFHFNGESNLVPVDPLIVTDETFTFSTAAGTPQTKQLNVLSEGLTEDITLTLTDANGVFTLGSTTISKNVEDASVDVTFTPTAAGTYTATVTLTSAGAESVTVSLSGTATEPSSSNANTTTFKLVTSTDKLVSGMRYIIACGSKAKAAGALGSQILASEGVTVNSDIITITDNVAVFVLEGNQTSGWTFKNESNNNYLYATAEKKLAYGTTAKSWTLSNGTAGVIMTYSTSTYGTMLCNVGSPRFTTYTSTPTNQMIQANLYMEYSEGGGSTDPVTPSANYYQPADGKKAAALKTAMCGIIYNRTEKSYDNLWNAFFTTDVRSDGKIWDMYSNATNYTPMTSGSTYSKEGDCYNREHSWPQSWFGSMAPAYTDLHHIYPTDGFVNGKRANYPFGEVANPTYSSANGFSKLGPCSYTGYTGTVFEPADEYKGDFARTYFYMVTCYEEKLHDWFTNYSSTDVVHVIDGTTYPALQTWQLNMLMEWAKNDPVSEKETARNEAVYAIQNNRNPFIDYPGLQEYIWGICKDDAFSYDNYVEPVYQTQQEPTINVEDVEVAYGSTYTIQDSQSAGGAVTVTSDNEAVATVSGLTVTPVAVGTAIITVRTAADDTYKEGSETFVLTVTAPEGVATAKPSSEAQLLYGESFGNNSGSARDWIDSYSVKSGVSEVYSGITGYTVTNAKQSKNTVGSTASGLTQTTQGTDASIIMGPLNVSDYSSLKLSYQWKAGSIKGTYSTTASYSTNSTGTYTELTGTGAGATTFVERSYTLPAAAEVGTLYLKIVWNTSNTNGVIDEVRLNGAAKTSDEVKLNAYGYATYCSLYPLDFTEAEANGYSAWQVKRVSGDDITFEKITGSIKGGQGILLKGTPSTTVTLASANSNIVLTGNQLYGTTAPTYVAENAYYGLSGQSFVKVNPGTVKAGKALLPASIVDAADGTRLSFVFEDDNTTTDISEKGIVNSEKFATAPAYNLNGQRVVNPKKGGLYIVGGKKVIVK